ncbi:putative DNA-directed RNA polymerase subunit beta [Pseudomonas phage PA1C]|uniref:DNA-directed RNA polymerase n=3 Tax=root TaxID=1 RepID=A0A5C1K6P1_9CAUD|nr:hypothetical protein PP933_gp069 [Pseudomonas phage vB_PaeM_PS119XW]QBX32220.1 putative DNA-directed RNA polymerase subunit beta [Pseudomonas phage PA1C]QEM41798.1 hypothetical protein [Pseudomonas phage vB_PaeM_PS119XW]BEG72708.1 hypothetical protein RVBP21_3360 [Pseudomonas phage BRkr]
MQSLPNAIREINLRLLGHAAIDPYYGTTSAARGAMLLSHIGQSPVVEGNEPRRVMAGIEMRYAEHTFDIRFPTDCVVLNIIRKYPTGVGRGSIRHNPVTTIVYEEYYDEFKRIGVIHVPEYLSFHQDFGFKLEKQKDVWNNLAVGEMFAKDTVIAQSTTVKENGLLGMGVNATVMFGSMPGTIEDGFVFCDEFLREKMAPRTYTTATGGAGKKAFFLNMYGDDKNIKLFPDIGERIRDDGVIFAVRDLDDDLSPAEMTPRALRTLDRTFDRAVIGDPGAIIKDIKVYWDDRQNPSYTPSGMDGQLRKYYDALASYYREIIKVYKGLSARRKDRLHMTEEFRQLVVEAMIYLPQAEGQRKLTRMYRLDQLDEWRVEITYESIKEPGGAYKATDFHGGKGVVCKIMKRADMPRDVNGNVADVVIFGGSTMRRSNYGRIYEHGFGAASRDLAQRLRVECGLERHGSYELDDVVNHIRNNPDFIKYAFNELLDFYAIVTPTMHGMVKDHPNPIQHVSHVLRDGFAYLYSPVDDPVHLPTASNQILNSRFCPTYAPVTYRDQTGKEVTTKDPMLLGPLYMMLLEKIGEDWSAVASVKTQQFGLPSKLNNSDRSSTPGRESAIRSFGESETRSYNCTVGALPTVELLDQTNNPEAHIAVINSILTADKPSNIEKAVDRSKIPFGNSRPVGLLSHLLECRGLQFKYAPGV